MLLDEPGESEALVDLLIGGQGEDHVSRGLDALTPERGEGNRARSHLAFHVERAAAPDLAVDEIARPGIARPLLGIGTHRVGVGEKGQRRTVAALQSSDEVEPIGRAADELAGNVARREIVAQQLRRTRLVAGRIDRVQPQQALQEHGRLVAEGQPSACDFAVSSLRTSQSSWYSTR